MKSNSKYPGVKNGKVEAAINKMGGLPLLKCFLSGKIKMDWVVWKTITFNPNTRSADYPARLEKIPCWLGNPNGGVRRPYVLEALAKIVTIPVGKVDLVRLTGDDLGFSWSASRAEICDRAMQVGLQMCPWAVGPELVLQFTYEEKISDWEEAHACIAMKPILGQCVFHALNWWRSVPRRLELTQGGDGNIFSADTPWVFVKSKK